MTTHAALTATPRLRARVHFGWPPLCGRLRVPRRNVTDAPDELTCGKCLRRLALVDERAQPLFEAWERQVARKYPRPPDWPVPKEDRVDVTTRWLQPGDEE